MLIAIQLITDCGSNKPLAEATLSDLREQEGCYGGRVLPPKFQMHGWAVQTFHKADSEDRRYNEALPDNARLVNVPDALRAHLGIIKEIK